MQQQFEAAVGFPGVVEQAVNRLGPGIVLIAAQRIGRKTHLSGQVFALLCLFVIDDACRVANGRRSGRNSLDHHGIRADLGACADGDRPENLRPGTDDHAVFQRRMPLALVP